MPRAQKSKQPTGTLTMSQLEILEEFWAREPAGATDEDGATIPLRARGIAA